MGSNRKKWKLIRVGNSTAVIIPAQILGQLGWQQGDELIADVDTRAGIIILKKFI
jgi:antitoxin component of MazEF toxin-antitoxin module